MLKRAAILGVLAMSALAGGCKSQSNNVIIKDDTALRQSDALRLATEAYKAQRSGDSDRAIQLYGQSLEKSKDLYPVWNNLALLLMAKQDYMHARDAFLAAADLVPQDPRPMYNVGVIYQRTGYDKEALRYFAQSLARDAKYLPSIRGAVATAKVMDLTDDEALAHVESGLMLENDQVWRSIFEKELLRIKGTLGRKPEIEQVPMDQRAAQQRWDELNGGKLQPSDPTFLPPPRPVAPATGEPQPQAAPEQPPPQAPEPVPQPVPEPAPATPPTTPR